MSLKEEVIRLGLDAPKAFFVIEDSTLAMIVGGCGPGKKGDRLVPDTVWGLSIRPACAIHDFDYGMGRKVSDRKSADLRFLANMLKIVETESRFTPLRIMRRYRIMTYYSAVAEGGAAAFEKAIIN